MDVWRRDPKDNDDDDNDSSSSFLSLSGFRKPRDNNKDSGYGQTTNVMDGLRAPPCLSDMIGMIGEAQEESQMEPGHYGIHASGLDPAPMAREEPVRNINSIDYRQLQERIRIVERAHALDNAEGLNQRTSRQMYEKQTDEPAVVKATTREPNNVEEELRRRLNDLSIDESQMRIEDLRQQVREAESRYLEITNKVSSTPKKPSRKVYEHHQGEREHYDHDDQGGMPTSPYYMNRPVDMPMHQDPVRNHDNQFWSPPHPANRGHPNNPVSYVPARNWRRNIKLSRFNGSTPSDDYLIHFEMVADANGWDVFEKGIQLAANLEYPASTVLGGLDPAQRQNFECLKDELRSVYGEGKTETVTRAELRSRMRKPQESLSALAHDLKRKTRAAYPSAPTGLQNTIATDHFILALGKGSDLAWHVHQAKPQSIEEAVTVAQDWESWRSQGEERRVRCIDKAQEVQQGYAPPLTSVSPPTDAVNKTELKMLLEMIAGLKESLEEEKKQQASRNNQPRQWPRKSLKDMECYGCREKGHIKRFCPKLKDNENGSGNDQ